MALGAHLHATGDILASFTNGLGPKFKHALTLNIIYSVVKGMFKFE